MFQRIRDRLTRRSAQDDDHALSKEEREQGGKGPTPMTKATEAGLGYVPRTVDPKRDRP